MIVSVFKTSLKEHEPLQWLSEELAGISAIADWNVDFEDCDRILRVVSTSAVAPEIVTLLISKGHQCIELD